MFDPSKTKKMRELFLDRKFFKQIRIKKKKSMNTFSHLFSRAPLIVRYIASLEDYVPKLINAHKWMSKTELQVWPGKRGQQKRSFHLPDKAASTVASLPEGTPDSDSFDHRFNFLLHFHKFT
jgi:hypothetical protein